jgi:hypothetical protein
MVTISASACCSTAAFLLEFIKVIIIANLFLVLSPTVKTSQGSAYDVMLGE